MLIPKTLVQGDTIGIVSPGYSIEKEHVLFTEKLLNQKGYKVIIGKNCFNKFGSLAGTDRERQDDMQYMLDNPNIKAILFSRGGYGCSRIFNRLNYDNYLKSPKFLIGYSDITCFHGLLNNSLSSESIHGQMCINFKNSEQSSLDNLFKILTNNEIKYSFPLKTLNFDKPITGKLVGGNLAVLQGLSESKYYPDFNNKILFIEDIGEKLYQIDRMLQNIRINESLKKLKGILIGHFTDISNDENIFPYELDTIINDIFSEYNIPIFYNFPAGHENLNHPIILGRETKLYKSNNLTIMEQFLNLS